MMFKYVIQRVSDVSQEDERELSVFTELPDGRDPSYRWAVVTDKENPSEWEDNAKADWMVVGYRLNECEGSITIWGPMNVYVSEDNESLFTLRDALNYLVLNALQDSKGVNYYNSFGAHQYEPGMGRYPGTGKVE